MEMGALERSASASVRINGRTLTSSWDRQANKEQERHYSLSNRRRKGDPRHAEPDAQQHIQREVQDHVQDPPDHEQRSPLSSVVGARQDSEHHEHEEQRRETRHRFGRQQYLLGAEGTALVRDRGRQRSDGYRQRRHRHEYSDDIVERSLDSTRQARADDSRLRRGPGQGRWPSPRPARSLRSAFVQELQRIGECSPHQGRGARRSRGRRRH